MGPALFVRSLAAIAAPFAVAGAGIAGAQADAPTPLTYHEECEEWDEWDKPAEPFRIFGNTYYVGTCGIGSILITRKDGHALIDSGTEAGAEVVLANIRKLGFDPQDIKVLLNSHEHFDHIGGMARLQAATGAEVISSEIGIYVMVGGKDHPDDPQAGMHEPMARITHGKPYYYGNAPELLAPFGLTPVPTPGHTPGAMTWSWRACEGEKCHTMVYADSLSAVSSDDYRFSDHPDYLASFRQSLITVAALDCEILLTPHPSGSGMRGKTLSGNFDLGTDCESYAGRAMRNLDARLAREVEENAE